MAKSIKEKLFTWLGEISTTKIDEGSLIQRIARDGYKYIEGDHEITIQVEMQSGHPEYILYKDTIDHWLPPYDREALSDSDKERVLERVTKFLNNRRISYVVH